MAGRPVKRARTARKRSRKHPLGFVGEYASEAKLWDSAKWVSRSGKRMGELARTDARAVLLNIANGMPVLAALQKRKLSWATWQGLLSAFPKLLEDAKAARQMGWEANHEERMAVAHQLGTVGQEVPIIVAGEIADWRKVVNDRVLMRLLAAGDPRLADRYQVDQTSNGKELQPTVVYYPTKIPPPLGTPKTDKE